ncbi:hypothetical protein ITJ38_09715 [Agreia pratensis]|uniref:DUF7010 family protein n=1 Tax=Agreia pratensis TaxID=150121 RepID=UPI00188B9879|nr:hypothetical protein [Agreia pratensis]MBF4634676.1 hypothetical protein [Agreia pratensis]
MFTDLAHDLTQLAQANRDGFAFLLAYGLTWLAAAGLWKRFGPRVGAYAVLFQGIVALPIAFGLQALTSAGIRPDNPLLDQLSTYLAVSQVFALPVIIYLIMVRKYRMTALAFAIVTLVHFAPYAWLYQTPLYLVLAGVLAIGLFVVCRLIDRNHTDDEDATWAIPGFVGIVLAIGSIAALVL